MGIYTAATVLGTVVSGVVVYVASEYVKEIWLSPLQEYKKIKQKVSYLLNNYACYYSNVVDPESATEEEKKEYRRVSLETRDLACELRAFIETISRVRFGIPQKDKIYDASAELIGLSNSYFTAYGDSRRQQKKDVYGAIGKRIYKINSCLGIYDRQEDGGQKK
jgi:hypothetical protein